jgi:SpoVK/Ycf46/Vps4 family AAA+-type ATPase
MVHVATEKVVSKWYGESTKNMAAVFDACEALGAVLFIDGLWRRKKNDGGGKAGDGVGGGGGGERGVGRGIHTTSCVKLCVCVFFFFFRRNMCSV